MTGRPSGRCAARLLAETIMKQGCVCVNDPLAAPPGNHCFFHDALAVLASPCCVSAADQEQVARLFHEAYERFRMAAGESVACAIAMPEPAIALLSAAKDMGREGMVTVWDSDGLYLGCLGVEVWRRLVEVGDDALSAADQEQVKEALELMRDCGDRPGFYDIAQAAPEVRAERARAFEAKHPTGSSSEEEER